MRSHFTSDYEAHGRTAEEANCSGSGPEARRRKKEMTERAARPTATTTTASTGASKRLCTQRPASRRASTQSRAADDRSFRQTTEPAAGRRPARPRRDLSGEAKATRWQRTAPTMTRGAMARARAVRRAPTQHLRRCRMARRAVVVGPSRWWSASSTVWSRGKILARRRGSAPCIELCVKERNGTPAPGTTSARSAGRLHARERLRCSPNDLCRLSARG